ncbi:MAG: hypothetical protein KJ077_37535 [Anaerolineae bacterium]|nr:hypothetical protein [Anaerolineae bacterium]
MLNKSALWTYQWRLIIALLGPVMVAVEVTEHGLHSLGSLNFDFWREVLIFGVFYPFAGLMMFKIAARTREAQALPKMARPLTAKNKAKDIQRVLIVDNELLLGAGLERLLSRTAGFHVVGVMGVDEETLIVAINHLQADVLIFDEASLLKIPLKLLTTILDYPDLRIVVVNTEDNRAQIYDKQQLVITQFTDLVKVIRSRQNLTS